METEQAAVQTSAPAAPTVSVVGSLVAPVLTAVTAEASPRVYGSRGTLSVRDN